MPPRLLSVSVDLDPLDAYHAIHGLAPPPAAGADRLTVLAVPRFLALFEQLGVKATFFVVGRDLQSPRVVAILREAVAAGHEVANHTFGHPYDFLDLPAAARADEVRRCHDAVIEATGRAPEGFRSPGYYVDGQALSLLAGMGYRYDSSMLGSLPYYSAKLAVMSLMQLVGRTSRSRLHPPTSVLAPDEPYRPHPEKPWRRGDSELWELPAASRWGGVPAVGTFIGVAPVWLTELWAGRLASRDFVSVEFHGIDLVDLTDGGLEALAPHQPGLRVGLARRRQRFAAFLGELLAKAEPTPLARAAVHYAGGSAG